MLDIIQNQLKIVVKWDEGTFHLKGDNRSNEDFADKLSVLVIKHNKTIHKISTGYSDKVLILVQMN